MDTRLSLEAGNLSHPGRRQVNQDWLGTYVPPQTQQLKVKGALFAVADGMGVGGAVFSRLAVQSLFHEYYRDPSPWVERSLISAVERVNARLYAQVRQDPSYQGTATTLVTAVIRGNELYMANVGDSRAYLFRGRRALQLTHDHSWTSEAVVRRILTPAEARHHPWRHILTRSLGSRPTVAVDLFRHRLRPGDTIVLCTDGLSDGVSGEEMRRLDGARYPQQMAASLVNLALRRGGDDNATAVVVRVGRAVARTRPVTITQPVYGAGQAAALTSSVGLVSGLVGAALLLVMLIHLLAPPVK